MINRRAVRYHHSVRYGLHVGLIPLNTKSLVDLKPPLRD